MDGRKIIYFSDELNDEFSTAKITPRPIDKSYIYCHDGIFKRFTHFFWYRIIATPIAFLYTKIKFRHKTVGRQRFKAFKKTGYFMYGNHTQDIGDAFIPSIINFPKTNYVIAHANNVSMPWLGRITPSLGALPLPDDMQAYRNFVKAVERRIREKHCVVIYPEAHIWPYYTKIRPFTEASFGYPVHENVPVFAFTNTYKKQRFFKSPRIVTYIDGPFYPEPTLSVKERKVELRNRVYRAMCEHAQKSDAEVIKYIKSEKHDG